MSTPLISVVVPTYNRAHLLPRTINSVLEQTYENLELIVVDDASEDNTSDIVANFKDPRIQYLCLETNRGASAARNLGINAASGDYIGFLDSDDEWDLTKLEKQVGLIREHPAANIYYAGWEWVDQPTGSVLTERCPDQAGRIEGKPRWAWNMVQDLLIEANLLTSTKFDESVLTYENYDLLFRLAQTSSFIGVQEVLVTCYEHRGHRNSDNKKQNAKNLRMLADKYSDFLRKHRIVYSELTLYVGQLYMEHFESVRYSRSCFRRALCCRPSLIEAWFYAALTFLPKNMRTKYKELLS